MYSEYIRYVEQLQRFHAVFPPEQVKILMYEDFRADNETVVRDVRRFLGVEDSGPVEQVQANPTVAPRSQRINELVHAVGVGRGPVSHTVKGLIKAVTPAGPRRRALYALKRQVVFGPPPAPRRGGASRAALALPRPGRGIERVPGPRPGGTLGL